MAQVNRDVQSTGTSSYLSRYRAPSDLTSASVACFCLDKRRGKSNGGGLKEPVEANWDWRCLRE